MNTFQPTSKPSDFCPVKQLEPMFLTIKILTDMKSKVRIILSVFILVLGFVAAQAQKGQGKNFDPVQKADKQTAMMTEKLSLSADQAAKVKDINLKYAEKRKAMKGETKEAGEKDKAAFQQLRRDQEAEINKVLNKDQQVQWEKIKAERKQHHGKGKGRKAGFNPDPEKKAERMTQHMTQNLGLSTEQAAKVKAVNLDFAKKHEALRSEKANGEKPDKAAMQKLRDEHQSAVKKLLTKEQYSKLEQMKKERKAQGKKGRKMREDKGM